MFLAGRKANTIPEQIFIEISEHEFWWLLCNTKVLYRLWYDWLLLAQGWVSIRYFPFFSFLM